MTHPHEPQMRIGALALRVGVSVDTLRAWERRYGIPEPARTTSGFRLYSAADEERLRAMLRHMASGLAPAQAAKRALAVAMPEPLAPIHAGRLQQRRDELLAACLAFDAAGAHAAIDDALAAFTVPTVVDDLFMWCLHKIGNVKSEGRPIVAEEHFTSALIRERMLAMARGWDAGHGPRALLACPPSERHDVGLIALGLALHRYGWRVTFLGADTPIGAVANVYEVQTPDAIVIAALVPERYAPVADELRALSGRTRLYLAGPGASAVVADIVGAELLEGDPNSVAGAIAARTRFSPEGTARTVHSTA